MKKRLVVAGAYIRVLVPFSLFSVFLHYTIHDKGSCYSTHCLHIHMICNVSYLASAFSKDSFIYSRYKLDVSF